MGESNTPRRNVPDCIILIADRSDAFVDTVKDALADTPYAVLHAKNGEEAAYFINLLKSEIKLAIIELDLPILSGLDLIWIIVKEKRPIPFKIIATTSSATTDGRLLEEVVRKLGVDAVARRPIPKQEWRKTIEAVFSGRLRSGQVIGDGELC
jgi:CheY-like chemotaxis protein